jgi:hypothetical protein
MLRAYKVFLATAYPQRELVRAMKRLLACLALCASLSSTAQDDNCTVLGVQELSLAYQDLNASIDSIMVSLQSLNDRVVVEYSFCKAGGSQFDQNLIQCVNDSLAAGWSLYGGTGGGGGGVGIYLQALVKYADD